jgi:predicted HicB family RNase H-like nuclease
VTRKPYGPRGRKQKKHAVVVRLTLEEHRALAEAANADGVTMSHYIRVRCLAKRTARPE